MSEHNGRRILVTGGAGFIGSHLVEELVRRHARVVVVDNLSTGQTRNLANVMHRVNLRRLDLTRDNLLGLLVEEKVDTIFHLAGAASAPHSVVDPRLDFEHNLLATVNLMEAVRRGSPQTRFLYTSSAAVYGDGSAAPLREEDPVVPLAPYGVSKLAGERYISVYARQYGIRAASLRLFPVHGPRSRQHVVYDLISKILRNPTELPIQGDGSQVRTFNHVVNVVEAFLLIGERGHLDGEVYNVSGEEPVSIHALAEMLCRLTGAVPRFVYSGQVAPGISQRWTADVTRLKDLGYRARVTLAEGLADTLVWVRQELAGAQSGS